MWNVSSTFKLMTVDRGATKEIIQSKEARIQFRKANTESVVALFSPANLDLSLLGAACGAKTFK